MALTKVRGGAIDNPLTLGGGSASDNSIIFDGNAQDFHVGLDDSADSLTIGLGSTLGTTSHMVFDANGIITKPLQPAFLVRPSSDQNNMATSTNVTLIHDSEIFDQGNNFASNTFTAPVTGRYQLNVQAYVNQMPIDPSYIEVTLVTSNRSYFGTTDPGAYDQDNTYYVFGFSVLADMDASDTAFLRIRQQGGSQQLDYSASSSFSGFLAC